MMDVETAIGDEISSVMSGGCGGEAKEGDDADLGAVGDLSSKFAAACVIDLTEDTESDEEESLTPAEVKRMTVAILKEEILARNEDTKLKGKKKAQLQEVRSSEERSNGLTGRVYGASTSESDISVSNTTNTSFFATRFARCSYSYV